MYEGKNLFAQILEFLPRKLFRLCVDKHNGDAHSKGFSCRDQFLAMAFAQLTQREGLRGIQETLNANSHCLYHMGFRCKSVHRNTLAHANEVRPSQIYADLAAALMKKARKLYKDELMAVELDSDVFAVDSTTIELCLKSFQWAKHYDDVAGIKMHVALELHGNIPDFIMLSEARENDLVIFEHMTIKPGAHYIVDRGYFSFDLLRRIDEQKAFYVTRPLRHVRFEVLKSMPVDKSTGLRCDQVVKMTGHFGKTKYSEPLRRIRFRDTEHNRTLVFFTNNFHLPALVIAELYKQRWQVELFFKWIKQHLKIKRFYGHNKNAVMTQLWIAVSVYCLLAIIKKELAANRELHEIQEILSASVFQKMPILQAFSKHEPKSGERPFCNQLALF